MAASYVIERKTVKTYKGYNYEKCATKFTYTFNGIYN